MWGTNEGKDVKVGGGNGVGKGSAEATLRGPTLEPMLKLFSPENTGEGGNRRKKIKGCFQRLRVAGRKKRKKNEDEHAILLNSEWK